ncbi:hypothetical protein SRB17_78550 [Streptomyces sp. RB17]|uniref:IS200/IS605 family transposase n=1 Tax=Streptomyces sp. RB17 TaxID=2585197 RepID=UPI001297AA4C|nr:IS200/IS605 family transposase [Streptomyces sp. RB17]MQY39827.1 hypothetical protein [Streptomyces sp. RB17]
MSPRWNPHPGVRTGHHVVHNLHVHPAFVTKYRRKAFTDEMLTRHEKTTREVCADFEADLKQVNGDADHVHLLVHHPPKVQLSKLVNSLKGLSARLLRKEYDAHVRRYLWGGHLWSGSYFATSCGGAHLTVVKQYIENQKHPVG